MTLKLKAERIGEAALITAHMDARMGDNICGPSVIRVPEWVNDPLGKYYMYFADHKGAYIRLAYADSPTGPWLMHESGALELGDSLFPAEDPPEPPPAQRPAWARQMKGGYLYAHIASPDVHVETQQQRVLMYFHGLLPNGDQETRLATSTDGVNFSVLEPLLGPPYFRVFRRDEHLVTVAWGGALWRSDAWDKPFVQGPQIVPYKTLGGIGEGYRHGETYVVGDTLFVLFTRMGDTPERIVYCSVDMRAPWSEWCPSETHELIAPELTWEGADLPTETSTMGAERHRVRELRDPCVFEDGDKTYMYYCGAGESAIGVARLDVFEA